MMKNQGSVCRFHSTTAGIGVFSGPHATADDDTIASNWVLGNGFHSMSPLLPQGADLLSAFDQPQRDALTMLFLSMHGQAVVAAQVFWGLWLFPLAILVLRSGFIPRFLGVWLIINGFAYLALSFTGLLFPSHQDVVAQIAFPCQLGEIAFMLWILIMGARPRRAVDIA